MTCNERQYLIKNNNINYTINIYIYIKEKLSVGVYYLLYCFQKHRSSMSQSVSTSYFSFNVCTHYGNTSVMSTASSFRMLIE